MIVNTYLFYTIVTLFVLSLGAIGYLAYLLNQKDEENKRYAKQKENLYNWLAKEIEDKYKAEIDELKRYQMHYLVHMEERDKILQSLSTLIK